MRPPQCAVCDAREDCDLVSFRRTPDDEDWHRRAEAEGFVGHPPDVEWLCPRHGEGGRALTHLHRREALAVLRELDLR